MTTLHYVKKARKPIKDAGIEKGDSYYWWQFAFRQKQVSKMHPRRSQYMTQSPYLGGIYDIEDAINLLTSDEIKDGCIDDIINDINNIRDEAESSLDNIPDQLKEASAGATLQEYIDNLESWASDLEQVGFDNTDDDSFTEDAEYEWSNLSADEQAKHNEKEWIEERAKELLDERRQEVLDEIQGISYPG